MGRREKARAWYVIFSKGYHYHYVQQIRLTFRSPNIVAEYRDQKKARLRCLQANRELRLSGREEAIARGTFSLLSVVNLCNTLEDIQQLNTMAGSVSSDEQASLLHQISLRIEQRQDDMRQLTTELMFEELRSQTGSFN